MITPLKRFLLFFLLLPIVWPISSFASQTYISINQADEIYKEALSIFERGPEEYEIARSLFDGILYYQDSIQYVCYFDAILALTYTDFDTSLAAFRMLGLSGFQDADVYYLYTCARRAEQIGQYYDAIALYERIEILDSHERLMSLRKKEYHMENPDFELPPINARAGGYAYVMSEEVSVYETPSATEAFASIPFYQLLQINDFAYDKEGRLYAQTTISNSSFVTEKQKVPKKGYILAYFLHFLSDEEMQVLGLPYMPPLTGNGTQWLGTIAKKSTPIYTSPDQTTVIWKVNKGDTLWIVDEVINEKGKKYYKVQQPDTASSENIHAFGYVLADYFEKYPVPGPTQTPIPKPQYTAIPSQPMDAIVDATPDEIYNQALSLFLTGTEAALSEAMRLFLLQRSYQNSAIYADYVNILLQIESGMFDTARKALADLEDTGYFSCRKVNMYRGIAPDEPIAIADPTIIETYIQARELEANGQYSDAILHYEQLGNYLDAIKRCILIGAIDAEALDTPALFIANYRTNDQVSNQWYSWPMHPFVINTLQADPDNASMQRLFQYRERIMKFATHSNDEGIMSFSLPEGAFTSLYDVYKNKKDIDTLLHKKFTKAFFAALQDQKNTSSIITYYDDIVLEKVLSIDVSKDMRRWNVCVLLKMTEPSTGDIIYMPYQMSSEGAQCSCYFDSVSRSIEAFIQSYPLLFTAFTSQKTDEN